MAAIEPPLHRARARALAKAGDQEVPADSLRILVAEVAGSEVLHSVSTFE